MTVTIALTVAGCPLRSSFEDQVARGARRRSPACQRVALEFDVMTPGRARRADDAAARRRHRADEGRSSSTASTRVIAVASGKGGVGKSTLTREPRRRASTLLGQRIGVLDADVYGHSIPHLLGIHQRPVVVDTHDRAARARRPEADVDRLLPRRQRAGDVARPDAAPGARAVPHRRALGRARHAPRRHAARHRRRLDLARPAAAARRGRGRDDAAAARAGGRRPRGA